MIFKIIRNVKKTINKYIFDMFEYINLGAFLIAIQEKTKVNDCLQKVTSSGVKFYPQAQVQNHSNNRSLITIGDNTHIRGTLLLFKYGGSISIGDNCYVGEGTNIWSGDKLLVGNNVLISHNCNIVDTNSHEIDEMERSERYRQLVTSGHWETKGSILTSPILIKDYAWISFNVTILKGVTVGEGSIIGAGSVVTKDVPDWTLVAGNPAKIIRKLK